MTEHPAKPDRLLLFILAVIGVLVVVALTVVFTRGEPKLLDASTPEGVVQRYSAAVIDGDEAAAAAYLTEKARAACDKYGETSTANVRVVLVSTTEREDSADVRVSIVTPSEGGPFGPSEFSYEEVFDLAKEDGAWRIETAPWPLSVCVDTGTVK